MFKLYFHLLWHKETNCEPEPPNSLSKEGQQKADKVVRKLRGESEGHGLVQPGGGKALGHLI